MPRVDPPYPSFTFVLSTPPQPRNNRSSRLPAYRASHMGRYHPYPRAAPSRCEDRLMNTIDYRYGEEPLWEETVEEAEGATSCEDASDSESGVCTAVNTEREDVKTPTGSDTYLNRSKLVDVLTEVVMAVRRRYLAIQAVKTFLKEELLKGPRA